MSGNISASSLVLSLLKPTLLLAICFISYKSFRFFNRRRHYKKLAKAWGCAPPKAMKVKDPVFGLDLLRKVLKDLANHCLLEENQKAFKKLQANTISIMSQYRVITTTEPENVKCILATKFKDFKIDDNRKKALIPIIGEGIFTSDGQAWEHSRGLLKPQFARAQFDDAELFDKHADNLIKAIPRNGEEVDLQPLLGSAGLDIVTEFLFGHSTGSLDPERLKNGSTTKSGAEKFYEAFAYLVQGINGQNSRFGVLGLFLPDWTTKKHVKIMHNFVDEIIETAVAEQKKSSASLDSKPQRYTLLSELVKSTDYSQEVSRERLRSELLNILLAGRDTTDSLISNISFVLSQRPDILAKLQQEISDSDIPLTPSFSQIKSLQYLRAVINESERLYPNVPENNRQAATDTILPLGGGPDEKAPVFVAKGTLVAWSVYTMQRRKDLYGDDADEFKPERWLDIKGGEEGEGGGGEKKGLRVSWEYLPFHGGPRVCLGQQFALMEVSYLTVKIVREFKTIEAVEKRPWREKIGIVATIDGGVKVKVKPWT
ncbi:uncharacterized protein KY384_004934 [Bacidia gigantensis]|uniref:uncharacterized protein n=1 Tax=Bacidia gigantensis TaxID=2732470 RepID=UPI001D050613|nr:uncharacterized protein KY384_004934 [Bacidia gigantensis]KAG8530432.1 hypothetical protein KY384_004934 [Bacidia gigantensis]